MGTAFSDIAFTDSVKATQILYGSREINRRSELADHVLAELSAYEIAYISERDCFYQATVSESSWPYVQHRGGPSGFLKVLDSQTLGYADFHGNRQYLSTGNLAKNDRVCLFLMDYANQRRLKVWGHAIIVHEIEQPELIAKLTIPSYPAHIERAVIIHVDAYDWNCPQHITQRYTLAEIEALITMQKKIDSKIEFCVAIT
jgi:predicted pyridoxine 5'-phosphate oxidase superfamily flavin-nucleotide-binding protein